MQTVKPNRRDATHSLSADRLTVNAMEIAVRRGQLDTLSLRFYLDNPRVYSIVHNSLSKPSQDDIEKLLLEQDHVKELMSDIKRHGGLIDPLYVKDGTMEVIEGNSRLAAYRHLLKRDPAKWSKVNCVVLPEDVPPEVIAALLGQWHLKGKKEWPAYEQAGYLYRRVNEHGVSLDDLAKENGISKSKIANMVDAFGLMRDYGDERRERWSYYEEFVKSRKIAKARTIRGFDDAVITMIMNGEIERAQDVRDKLPDVCSASPKILKRFVAGELTLDEAYDRVDQNGGLNGSYQKLNKFRLWLGDKDVEEQILATTGSARDRLSFEIKHIHRLTAALQKKLGK